MYCVWFYCTTCPVYGVMDVIVMMFSSYFFIFISLLYIPLSYLLIDVRVLTIRNLECVTKSLFPECQ